MSRITKDFLNLDPAIATPQERYRMGWGGSILVSHAKAPKKQLERPKLPPPKAAPPASFAPPRYFSRGQLDKNAPPPIPYLLIETNEMDTARPVPGNIQMLRSLCRGKGVLRRNANGLVYLDIDNRFINMMLPYLQMQGLVRPPYFNLFGAPEGAHIPVILSREVAFHYLDQIEGIGKEFSFELEGLYSMEPTSWPEVKQVWFFKLASVDLENLRRRHFLTTYPGGHSFHIAVAIRPHVGTKKLSPQPLMRISTGISAA